MECNVRRSVAMLIGLLFGLIVLGQNTGDCFNAIAVCQGVYTEENSPPGEGDLPDEISATLSCLGGGEVDGQWYTFTVANSGQFCFSILPNNLANDYDWAVFNLTNASCSDIATNASLEVSCNFSGTPGVTGANAQGGAQNNPCIPVQTGQTYVLYVSNWSQSTFGYTLNTQIPGSTASIFDNAPPTLTTTINVECPRTEVEFAFSEQVLCASVQSTDISITGPGATYTITAVTSATCAAGGDQIQRLRSCGLTIPLRNGPLYHDHCRRSLGPVRERESHRGFDHLHVGRGNDLGTDCRADQLWRARNRCTHCCSREWPRPLRVPIERRDRRR
jgi:hypothetical protein